MNDAKTVFALFGAWVTASFTAALAWISWLHWATRRDCRKSDRAVAEQLAALARNQTAEQVRNQ